jgi:hypothetical protein
MYTWNGMKGVRTAASRNGVVRLIQVPPKVVHGFPVAVDHEDRRRLTEPLLRLRLATGMCHVLPHSSGRFDWHRAVQRLASALS